MHIGIAVVAVILGTSVAAFAHKDAPHHADKKMQTLHQTMKALPVHEEAIRKAVETRDYDGAAKEAEKVEKAALSLLKTKPHKNAKDRAGYRQAAERFQASSAALAGALKAGDAAKIQDAMNNLHESCNACHARYKD